MPGTKEGARKAMLTNLKNDKNFYIKLGTAGGKAPKTKPSGFALISAEQRKELGRKGGQISRRNK